LSDNPDYKEMKEEMQRQLYDWLTRQGDKNALRVMEKLTQT
jgi:hypothetical protein